MASEPQQTVTAEQLMALRSGPEALRAISEALQVKKMGPADHIRTKHEIKAYVESGGLAAAETLIDVAHKRLVYIGRLKENNSRIQSCRMSQ